MLLYLGDFILAPADRCVRLWCSHL